MPCVNYTKTDHSISGRLFPSVKNVQLFKYHSSGVEFTIVGNGAFLCERCLYATPSKCPNWDEGKLWTMDIQFVLDKTFHLVPKHGNAKLYPAATFCCYCWPVTHFHRKWVSILQLWEWWSSGVKWEETPESVKHIKDEAFILKSSVLMCFWPFEEQLRASKHT